MSEVTKKCAKCGKDLDNDGYCPNCVKFASYTVNPQAPDGQNKTKRSIGNARLINKETNERYDLVQSVSKVGRDITNDISLSEDTYISRYHAWVLQIKGSHWVEDLGSTNGTFINGIPLNQRKQIFPGDCLKFGRTELVFEFG